MATSRSLVLVITGLKREAALLTGANVVVIAGGGDVPTLLARLENLPPLPLRAVVSVGLGGALSPTVGVGDWVIGTRIVGPARSWESDLCLVAEISRDMAAAGWSSLRTGRSRSHHKGGDVGPFDSIHTGAVAASDVMVADAAAKAALHVASGALAVDMESPVAATFAADHGLPFAALRVISDGADRALPKAAQVGMKPNGGMDILAVLRELAKDPRQLPALIRTGREAAIAFQRLKLLGRHDLLGRLGVGDADLGQLPLDMV